MDAEARSYGSWNESVRLSHVDHDPFPGRHRPDVVRTCMAVTADGSRWFLLAASPDVRAQIEASPTLWPAGLRRSPIEGVLLPSADVDATAGLLSLREGEPLALYATPRLLSAFLEANALAATLR